MSFDGKLNFFVVRDLLQRREKTFSLILVLLVIGFLLRIFFIFNFPFTNDEGAYLYDAKTLVSLRLPAGDILTKAPSVILLFMTGVFFSHGSLFAARLVNLILGIGTIIPLYVVAENIRKKSGITAIVIWLLSSGPIVLLMLGHTETGAIFFALSCLALFFSAVNTNGRKIFLYAFLSGAVFVLALGARKTNAALIFPIGIIVLNYLKDSNKRNGVILGFFAGVILMFAIWFGFVASLYGKTGLTEALGSGYWEIITQKFVGNSETNVWGVRPLESFRVLARVATMHVVLAFLIVPTALYVLFGKFKRDERRLLLIPFFWAGVLAIMYLVWPTFLPDYMADFFAPLTIIFSALVAMFWSYCAKSIRYVIIFIFVLINALSLISSFKHPWTGMFKGESVNSVAEEINKLVPKGERVLTAAVIIPYISGHSVFGEISHPLWYRYDFINTGKKDVFLPAWKDVSVEIRNGQTKWFLVEHLTDYAYLRGKDNLIDELEKNWELVLAIPNDTSFRSNTLKLYKRKSK
jgi:hypothetical protein